MEEKEAENVSLVPTDITSFMIIRYIDNKFKIVKYIYVAINYM